MADADGEPPSLKQNSGMQPSFSPEPSAVTLEAKRGKLLAKSKSNRLKLIFD